MTKIESPFTHSIHMPVNADKMSKVEQTDELVIIHYSGEKLENLSFHEYQCRQQEDPSLPPLNKGEIQWNHPTTPTFEHNTSYIEPKNYLPKSWIEKSTSTEDLLVCTPDPTDPSLVYKTTLQEYTRQAEDNPNLQNPTLLLSLYFTKDIEPECTEESKEIRYDSKNNAFKVIYGDTTITCSVEEYFSNYALSPERQWFLEHNEQVKSKSEEKQTTINQLMDQKQNIESRLEQKITQNQISENYIKELDEEKSTVFQQFQTSFEKSKGLEKEIVELETTNAKLKTQNQTKEKENINIKKSLYEETDENKKNQQEIQNQKINIENLEKTIENSCLEKISLENAIDEKDQIIEDLEKTIPDQNTQQIIVSTRKTNRLAVLIIASVIAIAAGLAVTCILTGGLSLVVVPITAHFALTMGNFVFPVLGGFVLIEILAYGKSYSDQQHLLKNFLTP